MLEWIRLNGTALWWWGVISAAIFVGTLLVIPFLVARIPADYFVHPRRHADFHHRREEQHWFLYYLSKVCKNVLGAAFILAGAVMLALPGQGLLTILLGVMLIDFPKKRVLECRIVRQPQVHQAINWIRAKANRPPLQLPEAQGGEEHRA